MKRPRWWQALILYCSIALKLPDDNREFYTWQLPALPVKRLVSSPHHHLSSHSPSYIILLTLKNRRFTL